MFKRLSFNKEDTSTAYLVPPLASGPSVLTKPSPRSSPTFSSSPLPNPASPSSPSYPFPYTPASPSIPTSAAKSLDRPVLHKSLASLSALLVALDDYRSTTLARSKATKRLSKAVRDLSSGFTEKQAGKEGKSEVVVEALVGAAGMWEVLQEVEGKYAKGVEKDYEGVNKVAEAWFRKTAKEEKAFDDAIAALDSKVAKATASYQSSAQTSSSSSSRNMHAALDTLTSQHSAYMSTLSSLSAQVQQLKASYAQTIAERREGVGREVARVVSGMAEKEWRNHVEGTRRGGKEIGRVVAGGMWCEGGMEMGGEAAFLEQAREEKEREREREKTATPVPPPTNDTSPPMRQAAFEGPASSPAPARNTSLRGPRSPAGPPASSSSHPPAAPSSGSYDSSLSARPLAQPQQARVVSNSSSAAPTTTTSSSSSHHPAPSSESYDSSLSVPSSQHSFLTQQQQPTPKSPPSSSPGGERVTFSLPPHPRRQDSTTPSSRSRDLSSLSSSTAAPPAAEAEEGGGGELGGGRTLPRGFYVDPSFAAPTEVGAASSVPLQSPPLPMSPTTAMGELRRPTPRYGTLPGASSSGRRESVDEFGRSTVRGETEGAGGTGGGGVKREDSFVAKMSAKYASAEGGRGGGGRGRETSGQGQQNPPPPPSANLTHHRSSSRVQLLAKRYSSPPEATYPSPSLSASFSPTSPSESGRRPLPAPTPTHRHSTSWQAQSQSSSSGGSFSPPPPQSSSAYPNRPQFGSSSSYQQQAGAGIQQQPQQPQQQRRTRAYENASPLPSSHKHGEEREEPDEAERGSGRYSFDDRRAASPPRPAQQRQQPFSTSPQPSSFPSSSPRPPSPPSGSVIDSSGLLHSRLCGCPSCTSAKYGAQSGAGGEGTGKEEEERLQRMWRREKEGTLKGLMRRVVE
ncbi:hypothetical protein JCM8547_004842 [Rhodosporidiobolus lusitaniae]